METHSLLRKIPRLALEFASQDEQTSMLQGEKLYRFPWYLPEYFNFEHLGWNVALQKKADNVMPFSDTRSILSIDFRIIYEFEVSFGMGVELAYKSIIGGFDYKSIVGDLDYKSITGKFGQGNDYELIMNSFTGNGSEIPEDLDLKVQDKRLDILRIGSNFFNYVISIEQEFYESGGYRNDLIVSYLTGGYLVGIEFLLRTEVQNLEWYKI